MFASARTKAFTVFFCLTIVSISGCGSSDKEVSTASGEDGTKETTTTAPAGDDQESPAESTTTAVDDQESTTTAVEASTGPTIEVSETGFSVYTDYDDSQVATAGAVLQNAGDEAANFFEVVFSFKDASGKPVGTETATVYAVGPGETGYAIVDSVDLTGEPATVDASAVVDDDSFFEGVSVPVTVEGLAKEEFGDGIEVNGIASNETDEVYEYLGVSCVLRAGGRIVGGASGSLDTLVPGGSITWTARGSVQADAAECSATGSV